MPLIHKRKSQHKINVLCNIGMYIYTIAILCDVRSGFVNKYCVGMSNS